MKRGAGVGKLLLRKLGKSARVAKKSAKRSKKKSKKTYFSFNKKRSSSAKKHVFHFSPKFRRHKKLLLEDSEKGGSEKNGIEALGTQPPKFSLPQPEAVPFIPPPEVPPIAPATIEQPETVQAAAPPESIAQPVVASTPAAVPAVNSPVLLIPVPTPEASSASEGVMTTRDLTRPHERLQHSIEGFLLDQRSPHTRRAYGKDLKRLVQFLLMRQGEAGIERIDRTTLIAYKDSLLSEGLEHTTVDRHLATLRSFFRWLQDDGFIEKNPAEGVRFLNPRKLSTTVGFSDEEVKRLLKLPDLHTRTGSQHYAILMILFYCGLRRSELCELRTSSITLERGHKVLRLRGKGNSERLIVLVPSVWNALKHYFLILRKDPTVDQALFTPIRNNRTGSVDKPLDPSMIFYIVRRYAKLAGIQSRVSPHSCRATAISNARDHNVPDRAIQEFAGWASPDMITRYDKRRSAIEKSAAHSIVYGTEEREMPAWVANYESS